jgi:hypothetical protein
MSFHIGNLQIGKWIHGWKLFPKNDNGQISVKLSAASAVDFLNKFSAFINGPEVGILDDLFHDKFQPIIDKVNVSLPEIITVLTNVETLPDVADNLEGFKFADDPKRDKIYHDIVTAAAAIFSDGKLSLNDALAALNILKDF